MSTLILVTGDKGGVGKSFTSRALLDSLLAEGKGVRSFDTDKTNSTLYRFYSTEEYVKHLDFEQSSDLDHLLNELSEASTEQTFLVDCAARSLDYLVKWMQEVDFFTLQREIGFKIVLVFVLGPEKDCIAILKDTVSRFQDSVRYLIVKNLGKGSTFDLYDKSNTRKLILEKYQAIEVELPVLLEKTVLVLDRLNANFAQAVDHTEIQIADRSRVRLFRNRVKERLFQGIEGWL